MSLKTLGQLNPLDSLLIFDRFEIDDDLPKFAKLRGTKNETHVEPNIGISAGPIRNITVMSSNWAESDEMEEFVGVSKQRRPGRVSWWRRLFTKTPKPAPTVSVKYVFEQVLSNDEELVIFNERNRTMQEMIDNAKRAGQKSLVKQLEDETEIKKFENALFATGMKRFVSEAQLLRFVRGCERGLCLDWIQKFTRVIPNDIVDAKVKCDALGLFDNYVVLHYDPDNKATTQADRAEAEAKRRDPVLFGVMRGSRRLYFVGDWTDEFCTLTLQQIIDKLNIDEQTKL